MKNNNAGFTLIELMICVSVIGILSMLAYPSYLSSIQRSRTSEAMAQLGVIANAQNQYFLHNKEYALALSDLSQGAAKTLTYYSLTLTQCPAVSVEAPPCMRATASPNPGTSQEGTPSLWSETSGSKGPVDLW